MQRLYRFRRLCWLVVIVLVVGVGAAWLRDSSVVAVKHVEIDGASGQDSERLRSALTSAAHDMTTLHVREGELKTAAEPYPTVASISVKRKFPHTLSITVKSREPVAQIVAQGTRQAVAADGVILRGVKPGAVPVVRMDTLPSGTRVNGGRALRAIQILGAAPTPLRPKIKELAFAKDGIVIQLVKGPELRFGDASRPNAKWLAAARVLADKSSAGATYIDVAMPERPGAGGLEDPALQHDPRVGNDAEPPNSATTTTATAPVPTPAVTTPTKTISQ
jgi:cell division protein FtsQ